MVAFAPEVVGDWWVSAGVAPEVVGDWQVSAGVAPEVVGEQWVSPPRSLRAPQFVFE